MMIKIRFFIPNIITAASLTCGLLSLYFIIEGDFIFSAWLIAASMFFDGIDGKIARFLSANSKFGALFDTLSDFVSFGVVPAFLVFKTGLYKLGWMGILGCIIYIFCGGYRLIRYILNNNESGIKASFSGLPIPAAAGMLASFVLLNFHFWQTIYLTEFLFIILLFVSFLMVSKIEYIAIEKRKKTTKTVKLIIVTVIISIVFSLWYPYIVFAGWIFIYIMYGLIRHIISKSQ